MSKEPWYKRYTIDENGCWIWTGAMTNSGYGNLTLSEPTRKTVSAHCAFYEYYIGPIPAGLQIDHLCRIKRCVNPAYMEPVTRSENARRGDTGKQSRYVS